MNQDGMSDAYQQGASAQERAFRPEMARETESVLRRSSEESLDDYLKNINSYLKDLNTRLGAPSGAPEAQDVPEAEAQEAPFAADGLADGPYPEQAGDDGFSPYAEPVDGAPDGRFAYAEPYEQSPYAEPYGAYPQTEWEDGADRYDDAAFGFAEPMEPDGYVGGDWRAAVSNPELYPDLDDPAVTGRKSRKQEKRSRRKQEKTVKTTKGGKSRFSFVTTVINLVLYGGWSVLYFICLSVRSAMFNSAQVEMAAQGVQNYSVTISSPMFTVLKIMIYAMPVVLLLWMGGVLSAEKKQVPQLDKKLLIAAFAVDLLAGFIVIFDVLAARLVFGA